MTILTVVVIIVVGFVILDFVNNRRGKP